MKANTKKEIKKTIKKMKDEGIEVCENNEFMDFVDGADDLAASILGIDEEAIKKENKRAFYFQNRVKIYIKK